MCQHLSGPAGVSVNQEQPQLRVFVCFHPQTGSKHKPVFLNVCAIDAEEKH